jgi:hypothetical protein
MQSALLPPKLCAEDEGFGWLKKEIEDGQLFVTEQLAAEPADLEWQRIYAAFVRRTGRIGGAIKNSPILKR